MNEIKIKRVYEPQKSPDGYRVLVDKLWPRGESKEDFHYDYWAKDVAPSTQLREWYHEDPENRWEEFKKKYTKELQQSEGMKDFMEHIKGKKAVTLLYSSKNTQKNNAVVLQEYLEKLSK